MISKVLICNLVHSYIKHREVHSETCSTNGHQCLRCLIISHSYFVLQPQTVVFLTLHGCCSFCCRSSKKLAKSNLSSLRESRHEQDAAVCNGTSDAGATANGVFDPSGDYDDEMKKSVSFRRKYPPTSLATTNGFGHGSPPSKSSHSLEQTGKAHYNMTMASSSREASLSRNSLVNLRIKLDEDHLTQARNRGLGTHDHKHRTHDRDHVAHDLGLTDDFSEGVLMRATHSNSIAIVSPTSDNSQLTSASALSTSLDGSARVNSPASSLLLSPDEAILAEQYFPVTFGAMAFSSYGSMGVQPTPGAWLASNAAASKKSSRSGSHRHGSRRPGSGQSSSSSNSKSSSIDRIYLMATDSPGNGEE